MKWIIGFIVALVMSSAMADTWQTIGANSSDGHVTDAYAIDLGSIHAQGKFMMVTALLIHVNPNGSKTAVKQHLGIDCFEAQFYIDSENIQVISKTGKLLSDSKGEQRPVDVMPLEDAGPIIEPQDTALYSVIAQAACGDVSN